MAVAVLSVASPTLVAQGTPPSAPLVLLSRDDRSTLSTTMMNGLEWITLDEVVSRFQVAVREEAATRGLILTYRGRTLVLSLDQPLASVGGRAVALPAPPMRAGNRWYVPLESLPRAVALIYDRPIDLRRASRLLAVGDVRIVRVAARVDAGPPTRVSVDLTPAAEVNVTSAAGRMVLRVETDALDLALPASGTGLIASIRAGDQPNTVAIALAPTAAEGRAVVTTSDGVTRVAIEVPPAGPARAAVLPPAPLFPGSPRRAFATVALDPGHGGDDVGVRSENGPEEKELTLDVARRLRMLLESRLGLRVVMTRDDDRAVGLDDRAATANNGRADLLLSLHANASAAPATSGAEVFVSSSGPDERRAVAGPVLPVVGGTTRAVDLIPWDVAQARHAEESAVVATMVESELRVRVAMSPRALQRTPVRVLAGANMPAVLIEMAYLTNPEQATHAQGDEFRQLVAQALFEATARFAAHVEERRGP